MNQAHQHQLEERLAKLVAQPTLSNDSIICGDSIHQIGQELKSYGMHVTFGGHTAPWLAATTRPTKHPKLLLAAHIDILPPSNPEQLLLRKENGKLFGRGVFDMKFAIACYIELIKELARNESLAAHDLGILITSDEEVGGYNGTLSVFSEGWGADIVLLPDAIREGWKVEAKAKAVLILQLNAFGKSAHGSRPWEGSNALTSHLLPILQELTQTYTNEDPEGITLSLTSLQGTGGGLTRIPEDASAILDFRAFTQAEIKAVHAHVVRLAKAHNAEAIEIVNDPPVLLDKNNPLVKEFAAVYEDILGQPIAYTHSYGGSDARHIVKFDTPVLLVTPTGGGLHASDEWLAQDGLTKFYDLLKAYAGRIAMSPVASTSKLVKHYM